MAVGDRQAGAAPPWPHRGRRATPGYHAQLFVEQRLQREPLAPSAHLRWPSALVAHFGAALGNAASSVTSRSTGSSGSHPPRCTAGHLRTVPAHPPAAVAIGQQPAPRPQPVHRGEQRLHLRLDRTEGGTPVALRAARRRPAPAPASSRPCAAGPGPGHSNQDQVSSPLGHASWWRQRAAHVGQRGEGGDDRTGAVTFQRAWPSTFHRVRMDRSCPCPRDADPSAGHRTPRPWRAPCRTAPASSVPWPQAAIQVGAESLVARESHRRRQQGWSAPRRWPKQARGRPSQRQRRALAHAHRLAAQPT